jgi:hypothetical protein
MKRGGGEGVRGCVCVSDDESGVRRLLTGKEMKQGHQKHAGQHNRAVLLLILLLLVLCMLSQGSHTLHTMARGMSHGGLLEPWRSRNNIYFIGYRHIAPP